MKLELVVTPGWQWWTDVTALLCLAVTLQHWDCHTVSHSNVQLSHGKCHDTRLTHFPSRSSNIEQFLTKQTVFIIYVYVSDDSYKCKLWSETVHSRYIYTTQTAKTALKWLSVCFMYCLHSDRWLTTMSFNYWCWILLQSLVDIRQHYFGRYILSIADDDFSLLQKINKNEIVWNPNIIAFDKWQWYIEFMKQIPKRIINDPTEGWMGAIEMFWELIHFPNTYHFSYLNFPRRKNFAFIT